MRKTYLGIILALAVVILGVIVYYLVILFSQMNAPLPLINKTPTTAPPQIQEQGSAFANTSNFKYIFNMPGWQSEYLSVLNGGNGASLTNNTKDNFMLVIKNQNPKSYLKIEDNSKLAMKFFLSESELKTEKQGNYRFGLRFFSASSTLESNKDNIYAELGFFRDYQRKIISLEYFYQKTQDKPLSGKLKVEIPWGIQNIEIAVSPFREEQTRVKVTDLTSGKILGEELVGLVLFPKGSFFSTKMELGNLIGKININSLELFCTKCTEVL